MFNCLVLDCWVQIDFDLKEEKNVNIRKRREKEKRAYFGDAVMRQVFRAFPDRFW